MIKKLIILGNGVDWCSKSLVGFINNPNVFVINKKIPVNGKAEKVARVYFSYKMNRHISMPLKKCWYSWIGNHIQEKTTDGCNTCLLVYDHNVFGGEKTFVEYIRKKFSKIKIAYIFTNIVELSAAKEKSYVEKLNDWYDVVFAFDPEDAKKYNFAYSPLIYDQDPAYDKDTMENKENTVFYVGQAKDRLPSLMAAYQKLKKLGVQCDFHIAKVPEEDIIPAEDITYNQWMSYAEAVTAIQKSTCLLDAIQGNSTGLTIKTCEAVCYDKKLITTNKHVIEYPFYDPRYIRIIESPDDIDEAFFSKNREVRYSKEGKEYFSASSFLKRLDNEITKGALG